MHTQGRESENIHSREVCRRFPGANGRPRSNTTVVRWILRGVRLSGNRTIKLGAVRVGKSWYTTEDSLRRFETELTQASGVTAPRDREDEREAASVGAALDAEGL